MKLVETVAICFGLSWCNLSGGLRGGSIEVTVGGPLLGVFLVRGAEG